MLPIRFARQPRFSSSEAIKKIARKSASRGGLWGSLCPGNARPRNLCCLALELEAKCLRGEDSFLQTRPGRWIIADHDNSKMSVCDGHCA